MLPPCDRLAFSSSSRVDEVKAGHRASLVFSRGSKSLDLLLGVVSTRWKGNAGFVFYKLMCTFCGGRMMMQLKFDTVRRVVRPEQRLHDETPLAPWGITPSD